MKSRNMTSKKWERFYAVIKLNVLPSFLTWAKSCMPRQCYQLAVKQNYKVLTLGKLGSAERRSSSPETMSVEAPVLSLLGFGAAENFGSVILIPFWASEASLVRMRSRELSLWWSGGIRKRKSEVKNRRGMDRHSHERAGIYVHEREERNDIDKRARVECILVHELRQQDWGC